MGPAPHFSAVSRSSSNRWATGTPGQHPRSSRPRSAPWARRTGSAPRRRTRLAAAAREDVVLPDDRQDRARDEVPFSVRPNGTTGWMLSSVLVPSRAGPILLSKLSCNGTLISAATGFESCIASSSLLCSARVGVATIVPTISIATTNHRPRVRAAINAGKPSLVFIGTSWFQKVSSRISAWCVASFDGAGHWPLLEINAGAEAAPRARWQPTTHHWKRACAARAGRRHPVRCVRLRGRRWP